ncbi:hypothetical protein IFT67_19630 [Sphingomonas sp. CFBP 13728]|uniref:hypothetical protein n=1 Tax=Sphingomonas sp. CFBP 13728 TaxID=2775294 RepID=UPI00177C33DD|nr:hypothetical protein [Sphingomonas sp. CFBP 13728]MBD8621124.1 hypothetical protein [Sphingomonas sp. CFBP 13728]
MTGCDQTSSPPSAKAKAAQDPIAIDIDQIEARVRIAAAIKRIDELERQVSELQATPEKLDLDLLTRRVAALEAMGSGGASSPKPSESRQDKPRKVSKIRSTELESKSRAVQPTKPKRSIASNKLG